MNNFAIVSDMEGVAKLFLSSFADNMEDLSGHPFFIGGYELKIGNENVVTIPAEIMKEIGYHRKDGRYAVPFRISYRHVNKVKAVGANIIRGEHLGKYLEVVRNGKHLPREAFVENPEELEVLHPVDIPEWTQSGDM